MRLITCGCISLRHHSMVNPLPSCTPLVTVATQGPSGLMTSTSATHHERQLPGSSGPHAQKDPPPQEQHLHPCLHTMTLRAGTQHCQAAEHLPCNYTSLQVPAASPFYATQQQALAVGLTPSRAI